MHDHATDGKLDLVPMIDCIMLLLLFFLLTSSFLQPPRVIATLLPNQGQCSTPTDTLPPMSTIRIVALPDHLGQGRDAADWQQRWDHRHASAPWTGDAVLRIGGSDPFHLCADLLAQSPETAAKHLNDIHAYVQRALSERELSGRPRDEQYPVEIHCFSGFPWKVTMAICDAVRAYEMVKDPRLAEPSVTDLEHARSVSFGAPPIRNISCMAAGYELMSLAALR